ncbi:unnamed protein product [Lactuca virosa]|uniref:Uncharacterized protein n=1 Tax=Lactuca virosa TaxID=75947 RepID=A0AAU9M0T1_9ASTR|nr:unnamed protein product [Lactuca virosa]
MFIFSTHLNLFSSSYLLFLPLPPSSSSSISFAFAYFIFLSSSSGSHRLIFLPPLRVLQTKRFPSSIMKFFKDIFQPMRASLASYSSSTNIALMEPVIFKLVSVVVASKRKEVTFSCSTSTPQTICDLQDFQAL